MNELPLPDELIRKIYQYINPIYEYHKYLRALQNHDDENRSFDNILETRNNISFIDAKIHYLDVVASYALLMQENLSFIHSFIQKNPLFKRPDDLRLLKKGQYKTMWDYEYDKNIIECWNSDVWISGNNIVNVLKNGSLNAIQYHCSINNIHIPFNNEMTIREKRNYLAGKLMRL